MQQTRFVLGLALCCVGFGCSTAKVRVMPGESSNRVVVRDIHGDDAEQEAVKAANEYCVKKGKEASFVSDQTKYTGTMDEETRNMIHKGSQAAVLLGTMAANPGTRGAGTVLGSAGTIGYVMTSDRDYETQVEFKCR